MLRPPLPLSSPPASVCVLRMSALGDVTHMIPVVRTLQHEWPKTRLTWIVGKVGHALVGDIPGVEFVVFDKQAGWAGYRALWRQLRGRRFDVLLHSQYSLRANLASLGIRADLRLGYDRARARELHGLFINARIPAHPRQHVMDAYFSFIEALGVRERLLYWDLPIPEPARAWARARIPDGTPSLIISPCSSHRLRNWTVNGYARLAEHAVRVHGLKVLLTGASAPERELAQAITAEAGVPVENLVGRTSVKDLLALLERATAVVSPDSGPAHMANAVSTPVIGLYACTNPDRTRPYHSADWCVDRYDAAARRELGTPAADLPWGTRIERPGVMELITPEAVIGRLDALLAAGAPRVGEHGRPGRPLQEQEQGGRRVLTRAEALRAVADARALGERIVMTNGCFDLLHAGHVAYLEQARRRGDRLLVAVNDDASVQRLKGEGRPINAVEQRMAVLAGLAAVDWVTTFSEDTPTALIAEVLPDVLVKGGDYRPEQIPGHESVLAKGGRVEILDYLDGCSTTAMIERIRDDQGIQIKRRACS
jgi:heptosyltransferase I